MTGPELKVERLRRGLTLQEVAAHVPNKRTGQKGISHSRLIQIERAGVLTEADAGELAAAVMDAQWAKNQRLMGATS